MENFGVVIINKEEVNVQEKKKEDIFAHRENIEEDYVNLVTLDASTAVIIKMEKVRLLDSSVALSVDKIKHKGAVRKKTKQVYFLSNKNDVVLRTDIAKPNLKTKMH